MSRGLYIFVEGDDDKRFFSYLRDKILNSKYEYIEIPTYAGEKKSRIKSYISSIESMNSKYIFVADKDNFANIEQKKEKIAEIYKIASSNIEIVVVEIESWYIAGLNDEELKKRKIKLKNNTTEYITKEIFDKFVKDDIRTSYMMDIIDSYDIEIAKTRNESFKNFYHKYLIL